MTVLTSVITPFLYSDTKVPLVPSPNAQPESTSEAQFPDLSPSTPTSILIRASNGENAAGRSEGKKIKLSTIVDSEQIEGFFVRYAEVCKGGMGSLKKRDRSKAKEKLKAKKRKMGGGEVKAA
jgi:signal recognition particle subunit SRP14